MINAPFKDSRSWLLPTLLALFTAFTLLALIGASSALAASPWWHLAPGTRPANIQPGSAQDEVQELTVTGAPGETVALSTYTPAQIKEIHEGTFTGEFKFVAFEVGAEPTVIQQGLETELYGAGNVEVTGGPGTYRITFKNQRAGQPVALINTELSAEFGFAGTANVTETAKGHPDGEIVLLAENVGDAPLDGTATPAEFTDTLPAGVKAIGISAKAPGFAQGINGKVNLACTLATVSCKLTTLLPEYQTVEVRIAVAVEPGASGLNELSASGGGAPPATSRRALHLSGEPTAFGVEDYELTNENEGGAPDTQAGSHPFQQTTTIILNQEADGASLGENPIATPPSLARDLEFHWPSGLIGNPQATAQCTFGQFSAKIAKLNEAENECAANTAVGVAAVSAYEPGGLGLLTFTVPLFNLEPAVGEPARFGFFVPLANVPVVIDTAVRTGGDYGVTVSVHGISQTAAFVSSQVTVWGSPGDPRHDPARGWGCLQQALGLEHEPCSPLGAHNPPPFLTLPTTCSHQNLLTDVSGDSWDQPGVFTDFPGQLMPALTGCNQLPFESSIKVAADGQAASTPTGLSVDVHVPQEVSKNPEGIASSNVKDIAVTLPPGFVLNPAAADGLQACSEAQIGYTGTDPTGLTHFTPDTPSCPDAAKVATATIRTPLLPNPLTGAVYLATPAPNGEEGQNPFNALIAMYIVAKDPISGTLVKLPGKVTLDPVTGQISSTFEHNPQLPFEDAELHFFGGDRAPLATPAHCASYTTNAVFTPWSGNPAIGSSSTFPITSGVNGSPCPATLPFAPSLAAGTTSNNAGGFSPLTTTISRADGNQDLKTVQLHMPPGVSGILKGVPLCPEAQANAGTCGAESLIGKTTVSVGLGGDPFSVTGGQVFLTTGYKGAPFGLSIVNPAVAGPFDLGKVIVRAKLEIDPNSAAITVTTDEIPHILKGIPLQIKHVNVLIDRPGFTFNPTNCAPLAITGSIGSVEGATAAVSTPFQVTNCAALKFTPTVAVSTKAKPSKKNGSSLVFKIAYPKGAMGSQSWFNEAKFDLPKQLPARLTTIQKACLASVFDSNPAACPSASLIGHAVVHTPVLPVPLAGPVYFVSHGGAKFPDAVIVLQGYGITVRLTGETFINGKTGITSATFRNTPDVPFENIEVTVPSGPFSEFGANLPAKAKGSFCGQKLVMPTFFKAQNGLQIQRNTPVAVTGCPKHKKKHHARKRGQPKKARHAAKRKR